MKYAYALALLALAVACSDRPDEQTGSQQTGPSPVPSPSRVVLSGTVTAANGLPIPNVRVQVVEGVNADRSAFSNDAGQYRLSDLEPGTLTLLFTTGEYQDLRRTEVVRADTTLNVQLDPKGLVLSGLITTQWGEPINDVGVEAVRDGRVSGGGTSNRSGAYRIPTLPAAEYIVRAIKWGYVTPQRPVTLSGDATLDIMLDRVRVSIFGGVNEAAPCTGAIQDARVEIVSGPDAGSRVSSTTTGYELRNINWGTFRLRASKTGYAPAEVSMDVASPGSRVGPEELPAPVNVRQDFQLQRMGGC